MTPLQYTCNALTYLNQYQVQINSSETAAQWATKAHAVFVQVIADLRNTELPPYGENYQAMLDLQNGLQDLVDPVSLP